MPSLRAKFVNLILPLRGTKKRMSNEARMAAYHDMHVPMAAPPTARLTKEFDVERRSIDGMPYWRVAPEAVGASHVVYLHGGAYVNEMVPGHWAIVAGLVRRTGATVDVPLYPLAPRHTWRDAFPPLLALMRQIRSRCPAGAFAIAGDSAGGGLALALCQVMRDAKEPLPDRLVLLSPFLDVLVDRPEQEALARVDRMLAAPGLRWAGKRWAGDLAPVDPRISPLYGSLSGLPPMLVLTGTSDLLHSDAERLRDQAIACRISLTFREHRNMFHVWMAAPIREAEQALDEIATFLAPVTSVRGCAAMMLVVP